MQYKIKHWNELTGSWLKGIKWSENPERTDNERDVGAARLIQINKELSALYLELKVAGIKAIPEEFIEI